MQLCLSLGLLGLSSAAEANKIAKIEINKAACKYNAGGFFLVYPALGYHEHERMFAGRFQSPGASGGVPMKEVNEHTDDITIEEEAMEQVVRPKLQVGYMIPDFKLQTTDGREVSPLDYKEKTNLVIIFFNPKNGCEVDSLKLVKDRYNEIVDNNAEVLAIASGPMDELKEYVQQFQPPFPMLSDERQQATCAYCVTEAEVFVADKYGELEMVGPLCEKTEEVINQIVSTIEMVELECPECGVSSWPHFEV